MYRILRDKAKTLFTSLDLTLLTVMKDNKTFYEKFGYEICEPKSFYTDKIDIYT